MKTLKDNRNYIAVKIRANGNPKGRGFSFRGVCDVNAKIRKKGIFYHSNLMPLKARRVNENVK